MTWIYSILLSRTMNNFWVLNMLNIGFTQFILEEEREYNGLVEQQRRRGHDDWSFPWCNCYLMFSSIWCIDVHSLKWRTRMRTGHNGLGIYVNRNRIWCLLHSARINNTMRTEWTVRKHVGRVRTELGVVGTRYNWTWTGSNALQMDLDCLETLSPLRWTGDLTPSELDTNGLRTE